MGIHGLCMEHCQQHLSVNAVVVVPLISNNEGAKSLAENPHRSKHLDVGFHFLQGPAGCEVEGLNRRATRAGGVPDTP